MRPSDLAGLGSNSYVAYCFDEVVFGWGTYVRNELENVKAKTAKGTERKQQRKLDQLLSLNDAPGTTQVPNRFADPVNLFKKGR